MQSSGSVRGPLVEIFTSKSDCTEDCNRSNCAFLFDDRLNYSDANMVCVSVDDEMEGEPPSKTQQISGDGEERSIISILPLNAKGLRKDKHKKPRNIARRRRRKIRRIPLQRRRCRSWPSPGPAISAVGPRASWCGYGDALWKKHRAGRARVHRGTHGFVCWESMNLIDHGRNLRASLPSVRAIGDPLYPFCHFY